MFSPRSFLPDSLEFLPLGRVAVLVGFVASSAVIGACSTSSPPPQPPAEPAPAPSFTPEEQTALQDTVVAHRPQLGGVVVGVYRPQDGATWFTAVGDAREGSPLDADTVLEAGSVTKQFTAALVLLAQQEGKLSLDDKLADHLPEYGADERITLRHLMLHTSGIATYTDTAAFNADPQKEYSQAELVALFQHRPLEFAPGDAFSYSNSGYFLLGMVLEGVYGRAYDELLEDKLFTPLSMTRSGYCDRDPSTTPRAQGHSDDGTVESVHMSQPFAAGALCTTANDLMKWAQAWLSGDVVDTDLGAQGALNDNTPVFYSAGMFNGRTRWRPSVQHGGSIPGFTARVGQVFTSSTGDEDDGLIILSLSNHDSTEHGALAADLADILLPPLPASTFTPDDAQRKQVAGTYQAAGLPPLLIVATDTGLAAYFSDSPELPLRHERDFDYTYDDAGVRLRFLPGEDHLEFEQDGINTWMQRQDD